MMFHLIHALHLAGRCTECGECERACPMGIPLGLLKKKINKEMLDLFGYTAGIDPADKPPLFTFRPGRGADRGAQAVMKEGYITKAAWPAFVEALAAAARSTRPARRERRSRSGRLGEGDAVCLDRPAHGAPKGVIFPQSETLFTFAFSKDPDAPQKTRVSLDADRSQSDAVILCGRPCDARGFTILDRVFLEADPYYRERRERTTIITLACSRSFAGCFCTSVGGGPADKTGSDALVTELEARLLYRGPHGKRCGYARVRAWRTARLTGTRQRNDRLTQ